MPHAEITSADGSVACACGQRLMRRPVSRVVQVKEYREGATGDLRPATVTLLLHGDGSVGWRP